MKKLFTKKEFKKAKCNDLLPLECLVCGNKFLREKYRINRDIKGKRKNPSSCCSLQCRDKQQRKYTTKLTKVICSQCGKQFNKLTKNLHKSKSGNHFCCRYCFGVYNAAHKTKGYRRSKLELWIEEKLLKEYPNLTFKFNSTEQINAELDIFVEDYKLAFELNGIFHYEPIFPDRLARTQNNDRRKFQVCGEKGIELCVIDTSSSGHFKPDRDVKYYNIIKSILDTKIKN